MRSEDSVNENGQPGDDARALEWILVVENSFRAGVALGIARIFRNEEFPKS